MKTIIFTVEKEARVTPINKIELTKHIPERGDFVTGDFGEFDETRKFQVVNREFNYNAQVVIVDLKPVN